jgi:hypothetical protein
MYMYVHVVEPGVPLTVFTISIGPGRSRSWLTRHDSRLSMAAHDKARKFSLGIRPSPRSAMADPAAHVHTRLCTRARHKWFAKSSLGGRGQRARSRGA